jgi:membrane-associated protease RseP (regulator of RpoE activity)
VFNQGKLSGYRIFPGGTRGTSAFTQLGLRAGDLVVGVNGTALDDAGRAMEILQTLSSSASATVTVSRNGLTQEVNLNLANLNVDAESNPGENPSANGPGAAGDGQAGASAPGQRGRGAPMAQPPTPPAASGVDPGAAPTDSGAGANGERER